MKLEETPTTMTVGNPNIPHNSITFTLNPKSAEWEGPHGVRLTPQCTDQYTGDTGWGAMGSGTQGRGHTPAEALAHLASRINERLLEDERRNTLAKETLVTLHCSLPLDTPET